MTDDHPESPVLSQGGVLDDRYEIAACVSRSAGSQVFRARHIHTDMDVAIKVVVLGPESTDEVVEERIERLRREATVIGQLGHRNTASVHDFGFLGGDRRRPYLVMDFLDGETLAQRLASDGPLSVERTRSLARDCLDVLRLAHEKGITHKAIAPDNLFLVAPESDEERMILLDFGRVAVTGQARLTQIGQQTGNPSYLAPEYIDGGHVSSATDVYQMGLVLAEMVTGNKAVPPNEPLSDSLSRHVQGKLAIEPEELGVLATVVLRATANDPAARYDNAGEMVAALAEDAPIVTLTPTADFEDAEFFGMEPEEDEQHTPSPAKTMLGMGPPVRTAAAVERQSGAQVSQAEPEPGERQRSEPEPGERQRSEPEPDQTKRSDPDPGLSEPTPNMEVAPTPEPATAAAPSATELEETVVPSRPAVTSTQIAVVALAIVAFFAMVGVAIVVVVFASDDDDVAEVEPTVTQKVDQQDELPPTSRTWDGIVESYDVLANAMGTRTVLAESRQWAVDERDALLAWEKATAAFDEGDCAIALDELEKIPADHETTGDARFAAIRSTCSKTVVADLVKKAQTAMVKKQWALARGFLDEAERLAPDSREIRETRRQLDAAEKAARPKKPKNEGGIFGGGFRR